MQLECYYAIAVIIIHAIKLEQLQFSDVWSISNWALSFKVIPSWSRHGVKSSRTITMVNRIVWSWMVAEIGCGMMWAAIWIISILFVSMVSVDAKRILNESWSSQLLTIPISDPLSCGSPDALQNTTIIGKNYTIGSKIQYTCPKGHSLIGDETRECKKKGAWSGTAPTCKYIDCGSLPSLQHGGLLFFDNRTTFGAQVTYTCHENYTLIGNENRTCELNGWSGKEPQCLVDWCPDPPPIQGGQIRVSGRRAGSTATYECEVGHVLIGESILSCGLGGEWTGKIPVCRFVDCGTPARPDRGNLNLLNDSTTVGSIVKYFCDDDYWLVGPEELTCAKDGKWSGSAPSCECKELCCAMGNYVLKEFLFHFLVITCETPHVPAGSYVVGYDYNVHSVIKYHCDDGHVLHGESELRCLETGEWSHEAPYCDCEILFQSFFLFLRQINHKTLSF